MSMKWDNILAQVDHRHCTEDLWAAATPGLLWKYNYSDDVDSVKHLSIAAWKEKTITYPWEMLVLKMYQSLQ